MKCLNLKGVDEENGKVYYTAFSKDGLNKDVFIINLDGSDKKQLTFKDGFNNAALARVLNIMSRASPMLTLPVIMNFIVKTVLLSKY